jgi:hypothetical protein
MASEMLGELQFPDAKEKGKLCGLKGLFFHF